MSSKQLVKLLLVVTIVAFSCASNVWCLTSWDTGGTSRVKQKVSALNPICLIWSTYRGLLSKHLCVYVNDAPKTSVKWRRDGSLAFVLTLCY